MTPNQQLFFVGNTVAFLFFYMLVGTVGWGGAPSTAPGLFHVLIAAHAAIAAVGFLCWLFVEMHDPSLPSLFGDCLPTTRKWTASKYVSEHRKPIEGLDHFCSWLNVAIARSNYVPFFVLTLCGVAQYLLQAAVSLLLLTLWHPTLAARTASDVDPGALAGHAAALICAVGSLGMGFPFSMLLAFHVTLIRTGESTYSYIQNAQKREYRARKSRTAALSTAASEALETTALTKSELSEAEARYSFGSQPQDTPGGTPGGSRGTSASRGGGGGGESSSEAASNYSGAYSDSGGGGGFGAPSATLWDRSLSREGFADREAEVVEGVQPLEGLRIPSSDSRDLFGADHAEGHAESEPNRGAQSEESRGLEQV